MYQIMRANNFYNLCFLLFLFILSGCFSSSISEKDSSAGLNGSFEKVKFALPLNWNIYAPDAYKKTYDLVYDTIDAKDGKQSFKFEIKKVDPSEKTNRKPGFYAWIDATTGEKYKVSFWVKNKGCDFKVSVYSPGKRNNKPIVRTKEKFENWKYFEYEHTVPKPHIRMTFEVNIFSPGEFWIDDVKIEKL